MSKTPRPLRALYAAGAALLALFVILVLVAALLTWAFGVVSLFVTGHPVWGVAAFLLPFFIAMFVDIYRKWDTL